MAAIARDVIMTFRGQNYLSSAIRAVGRDVGGLSKIQSLKMSQAQNALNMRRLATQKAQLVAEQTSIQNGSRALTMQMRQAGLKDSEIQANRTLHGIETRRYGVSSAMARNLTKIQQIQMVAQRRFTTGAAGLKLVGLPPDFTAEQRAAVEARFAQAQAEIPKRPLAIKALPPQFRSLQQPMLEREFSGQITEAVRLDAMMKNINMGAQRYSNIIANQSLASQKFAAATREEAIALRLKGEQVETINIAELRQIELQKQLFMQQQALPTEKWLQYTQAIEHTGHVLQMFGVVGTAVFAYLAKGAADFQTQATLAATQARPIGASVEATAKIAQQVTKQTYSLMSQFPASSADQLKAFYEIFSGTNIQSTKVAAADLKVFNEMAVAGQTDLASMTQAGITLFNTFPHEFKNMTAAGNAFFSVVRYGRITADQLAGALGYITPIAKLAGLSFEDVGQSLAFLTRQTGGKMIRMDAQGLGRTVQLLGRADVSAGLAAKGIDVFSKQTGKMRNPALIVEDIHKHMKMTNAELLNFFKTISAAGSGKAGTQGTIQAIRTFGQFYNAVNSALSIQKKIRNDNGELQKSYESVNKTAGVSLQIFVNRLKLMGLIIGAAVIPIFQKLSVPITWIAKAFNDLSPHMQHIIGLIAGIGAVAALLVGTFLVVGGTIAAMGLRLRLMIGYMREGQGLFGKFGFSALTAGEQLDITNATLMSTNEQLIVMKGLISDIATGAPISQNLSTGLAMPTGVILPPGVERKMTDAKNKQLTERFATASPVEQEMSGQRRTFGQRLRTMGRRAAPGEGERGSIGVGSAAMMGMMALPLATQVPMLNDVIKKLGGIKTLMIAIGIIWAGIFIRAKAGAVIGPIISGLQGLISKIAATTVAWVTGQATMQAAVVETAVVTDTAAATMSVAMALATAGISIVVAALAWGAAYAITHWSKVRRWFGTFWGWLKVESAGIWSAMIQDIKFVGKAILDFVVAPFRMIIDAMSHLPKMFGGGIFQKAKAALDAADKALTPDWTAPGAARARERAAQASSAAATKAANEANAQATKQKKQVDHIHKQIEQAAFQHRVRTQTAVMQRDPNVINEIRSLQTLKQRAIAETDLNKRYQLATRYATNLAKAEQGLTAAQKTAFRELLTQGVPSQEQANRSAQQWIKLLVDAKKYMDSHPYDIKAAQKFENLQTELNTAFKGQPALLSAINDVMGQYNSNLKTATKNGQDAAVTMDQVRQGVDSLYQSILQTNQTNMGTFTQGPWLQGQFMQAAEGFGFKPRPSDFLKDAHMQLRQFNNFNKLLDGLRRRGAPEALIQQLQQLGPSSIKEIRTITRMSQPELRKYFGVFQREQTAIHRATMSQLNSQLKDYLKYGRKVGLAMAAGVRQESPAISKAIDNAIRKAFGNVPTGTAAPGGGRMRGGTEHHKHEHVHVHVTTNSDNLDTKLRHARFRAKQRHNHPDFSGGGRN